MQNDGQIHGWFQPMSPPMMMLTDDSYKVHPCSTEIAHGQTICNSTVGFGTTFRAGLPAQVPRTTFRAGLPAQVPGTTFRAWATCTGPRNYFQGMGYLHGSPELLSGHGLPARVPAALARAAAQLQLPGGRTLDAAHLQLRTEGVPHAERARRRRVPDLQETGTTRELGRPRLWGRGPSYLHPHQRSGLTKNVSCHMWFATKNAPAA